MGNRTHFNGRQMTLDIQDVGFGLHGSWNLLDRSTTAVESVITMQANVKTAFYLHINFLDPNATAVRLTLPEFSVVLTSPKNWMVMALSTRVFSALKISLESFAASALEDVIVLVLKSSHSAMAKMVKAIRGGVTGYAYPIAGVFFLEFYDIINFVSFISVIFMVLFTSMCCCACHH